ncbi:MOSC domain-containing protein [Streptacidiphilus anmyonensis]|uniref:MOSC domain-containing protein n=1 Tax=Streptacidiphilus anmyonensis TaxID=405782 RepID=UPI0005A81FF4|nr:MOSC N-terminal beta barrel domain-containing protein [Streptacidiphilus anmyonensis]
MATRLTALRIHPVKSFHAQALETASVEPWGLAGDRRWMLVQPDGEALTQREDPRLARFQARIDADGALLLAHPDADAPLRVETPDPAALAPVSIFGDGFTAPVVADPDVADWFGKLLDREVRLVHLDDPHRRPCPATTSLADAYPFLLTTTASLDALNALIAQDHPEDAAGAGPLPMERFRPNLVLDEPVPWAETGWLRIRIGAVEFEVVQQCGRCVITTVDQEAGVFTGPQPLRTLRKRRRFAKSAAFGMHLVPQAPYGTLGVGDELTVLESGPLPQAD